MITRHSLRACRAVRRLIAMRTPDDEQIAADTAFDAGEWSEPAIGQMHEQIESDSVRDVALRFGYLPAQLHRTYYEYEHHEWDRFSEAFWRDNE